MQRVAEAPVLQRTRAKRFYSWLARTEHSDSDSASYGKPTTEVLMHMLKRSVPAGSPLTVLEFGCGSGRLAERMLRFVLPDGSFVIAADMCEPMVLNTTKRFRNALQSGLLPDQSSFEVVELSSGEPSDLLHASDSLHALHGRVDVVLSTYVLDLLDDETIHSFLSVAKQLLNPQAGLLALAGITFPSSSSPLKLKATATLWQLALRAWPTLVGGCRPQYLDEYVHSRNGFHPKHVERVNGSLMPSEALLASIAREER